MRAGRSSVLDRIIAILDAVKDAGGSIVDHRARGRDGDAEVHRVATCRRADAQRYLERTDEGVTLGLRLFELGARASLPRRLLAAAAPVIRNLRDVTGERVGLWVQQGTDMVSIAAVAGRLPMLPTRAGMRSPALTTASGKAYLAFCADQGVVNRVSAPLIRRRGRRLPRRAQPRARLGHRDGPGGLVSRDPRRREPGALRRPRRARRDLDRGPSGAMDPERVAPLVRAAGATLTRRLTAA